MSLKSLLQKMRVNHEQQTKNVFKKKPECKKQALLTYTLTIQPATPQYAS